MYLITLPVRHLAKAAYLDSLLLSAAGHASWFSDLHIVLQRLPAPIQLPHRQLEVDDVIQIRTNVTAACAKWLGDLTLQYASRLPLIQECLEKDENGNFVHMAVKYRHYPSVPIPAHRKALTRLLLSSHTLAIEILFCRRAVESESHALLGCMSDASLMTFRREFLIDVYQLEPNLPHFGSSGDTGDLLVPQESQPVFLFLVRMLWEALRVRAPVFLRGTLPICPSYDTSKALMSDVSSPVGFDAEREPEKGSKKGVKRLPAWKGCTTEGTVNGPHVRHLRKFGKRSWEGKAPFDIPTVDTYDRRGIKGAGGSHSRKYSKGWRRRRKEMRRGN
ncbi:hypothetical protein FB451DRAFT_1435404 [Mycena latifolia]|nr:hypothetical protein FB451DRAFT_1435404 [Mycena latifolia]